jgi:hypothetical protein
LPDPTPEFAGSIFGLQPGVSVEVRVTVTDPDGGGKVQTITGSTRAEPLQAPAQPRHIAVSTASALSAALSNAEPGDVIDLAPVTFSGAWTISRSGTAENPIVIRGAGKDATVIDATGAGYGMTVAGSHVYVEDLTIRGSDWALRLSGNQGIVLQRTKIADVNKGVDARNGSHRDFYIYDNLLEGRLQWPNISNTTWNEEGIVVTGEGSGRSATHVRRAFPRQSAPSSDEPQRRVASTDTIIHADPEQNRREEHAAGDRQARSGPSDRSPDLRSALALVRYVIGARWALPCEPSSDHRHRGLP